MQNLDFLDPKQVLFQINLNRGAVVADLGAGSGFFSLAASGLVGENGKVFAVDILETALEHISAMARIRRMGNIITLRCNLEQGSIGQIPSGIADLAIMANVLHQIKNRKRLFNETYRMLKTGGELLVLDWNNPKLPISPATNRQMKEDEISNLAAKTNLRFNKDLDSGQHHFGLLFTK